MSRARDLSKLVNILEVRDGSPFAITQSGRVGIGTTIPTSALSVEGDGEFTGIVSATSFKATGAFVGDGSGLTGVVGQGAGVVVRDGGSLIGVAGTIDFGGDNFFVTPVSSGIVTVTTGPSSKWTQNNTGIHTLGNVGIGTTTASSTLSVLGNATISGVTTVGFLAIGATTVLTAARQLQNIASLDATTTATIEAAIQSSPNLFTELRVTGITTLGVTSTTDLSAQKLNVSGIATANSFNIGVNEVLSSGRQLKNITSVDGTTAASINAAISQATQNFPSIEVTGISSFMNGPVLIGSGTSTAVPDQKLQVTGSVYISSEVGIGTVDPKANLWVEGSTQVSGAATISGSTTLQGSLSVAGAFTQANATAVIADASGSSNIFVGVATGAHGTDYQKTILIGEGGASGSLTNIVVGPTEGAAIGTFAINSSTKVGIGSIYPTSQLSLEGDQYVSGIITARTFSGTLSGFATGSFFGNINSPVTGIATIFNIQGTNLNVGLATANRFISTTGAYISGGSLNDGLRFELVSAANPLEFHEYTSIVASLDDKSYSQISPSATGDLYIAPQTTSSESSVRIFTGTGTPDFNAVERITVTGGDNTNGNVGIGSTQPTSKLTVQGDVRISGVSTFSSNINVGVNTSVGIVLTSPNGTKFRLHVRNDGTLSTVQV